MKPCPNRLQEALPRRPVNGLNIEIGTPAARCKLKTPEEWAGREPKQGLSLADRWIQSGGSCLVFGCCENCQASS